jgi:orotidine-5'-phosphate decarboxylase
MPSFVAQLAEAIRTTNSVVCVGLDPVLEQMPIEVRARHQEPTQAIREFCFGIIDAVAGVAPVVKPQSACFERYGARGVAVLEDVCAHARARGLLVLLDAKRGDIGISANHYAASAVHCGAHAITVNGYLGPSTIEPYLAAGLGVFVLVRTSNPDSDAVQSVATHAAGSVAEMMARHVATLGAVHADAGCGLSNVGAVVGATKSADAAALRAIMPDQVFLIPGYGAQGGTARDIMAMARVGARTLAGAGVLVNASRSILYASAGADWQTAAQAATQAMSRELNAAVGPR